MLEKFDGVADYVIARGRCRSRTPARRPCAFPSSSTAMSFLPLSSLRPATAHSALHLRQHCRLPSTLLLIAPPSSLRRYHIGLPRLPRPPLAARSRWLSSTSRQQQDARAPTPSPPHDLQSAPTPPPKPKMSLLSRFFPSGGDASKSASSFRAIVSLAKPEKKPLTMAVGLLMISSAVSMSVPVTIGKLIDYFTSTQPVRASIILSSCLC